MRRLFLALTLVFFVPCLVTGCGEDTDELGPETWQGTWKIAMINGVPFSSETPERVSGRLFVQSSTSGSISFDAESGVFKLRVTMTFHDPLKIELKKDGSATLEVIGAYTVHGQAYTLGVGETRWEVSDSLQEIGVTEYSLETLDLDLDGAVGIWERRGDQLVLTNSYGNTVVFERS